MDTNKFNLWRACFSFCFVDGFLSPDEEKWIGEKLKVLKLTDEQRQTLMNDLHNPPAVRELLPLITSKTDRACLLDNMRVISKLDKQLTPAEKQKIDKVRADVMAAVNVSSLSEVVDEIGDAHRARQAAEWTKRRVAEHIFDKIIDAIDVTEHFEKKS